MFFSSRCLRLSALAFSEVPSAAPGCVKCWSCVVVIRGTIIGTMVSRAILALLMASSAMCTTPTGDYVWEHNVVRCLHCDTPIARLSASLEADAQSYAATCPTGHAERSARNGAGENLYWADSSDGSHIAKIMGTDAASRNWYETEEGLYAYYGEFNVAAGHFTAMVWKATSEIGCGKTDNFVVCRYTP